MKLSGLLELTVLSASLLLVRLLGLELMGSVFEGLFVGGLCLLYVLGQTRAEPRWKIGPAALRTTCWMGYAVVLSHIGSSAPWQRELLAPGFLLCLALLASTRWAFIRCFDSSRRHVSDGRRDRERDLALSSMLRAVGLVAGAGLLVTAWYSYFVLCLFWGTAAGGQHLMAVILLCGLGLSEAISSLVFGERICTCCATPSSGSQIMFSRAAGLLMVVAAWSGLIEPQSLVLNVGAGLYLLAVLSSGSPASLPVQFRPKVEGEEATRNMWTTVALSQVRESIAELRKDVQSTRASLPPRELGPEQLAECSDLRSLLQVDPLIVGLGPGLRCLLEPRRERPLGERISVIRERLARELGLVLPGIHCRESFQLRPNTYVIRLHGTEVAQGEVFAKKLLAIGPEEKLRRLTGEATVDPIYGMPGVWIGMEQRAMAERCGCMIFCPTSVIGTHLTEKIRCHARELLGVAEVSRLLEAQEPVLVGETVPSRVSLVQLRDILRSLLHERVSIRNMRAILEHLAGLEAELSTEAKVESVRAVLAREICKEYQNHRGVIQAITLASDFAEAIEDAARVGDRLSAEAITIDPNFACEVLMALSEKVESVEEKGLQALLVTSPPLRPVLKLLTQRSFPNLVILSWSEITSKVDVISIAVVDWTPQSRN